MKMNKKTYCMVLLMGLMMMAFTACDKDVESKDMPNYLQVSYENMGKTPAALEAALTKEGFVYDTKSEIYTKTFSDGTECQLQPDFVSDSLDNFIVMLTYPATTSPDIIKAMYKKWNDYAYNTMFRPIGLWGSVQADMEDIEEVLENPEVLDGAYVDGPLIATMQMMLMMAGGSEIVGMINEMLANTHPRTDYIANDAYASFLQTNDSQAEMFLTLRGSVGTSTGGFDLSQLANAKQESGYMAGMYDKDENTYNLAFIYNGIQVLDIEDIFDGLF